MNRFRLSPSSRLASALFLLLLPGCLLAAGAGGTVTPVDDTGLVYSTATPAVTPGSAGTPAPRVTTTPVTPDGCPPGTHHETPTPPPPPPPSTPTPTGTSQPTATPETTGTPEPPGTPTPTPPLPTSTPSSPRPRFTENPGVYHPDFDNAGGVPPGSTGSPISPPVPTPTPTDTPDSTVTPGPTPTIPPGCVPDDPTPPPPTPTPTPALKVKFAGEVTSSGTVRACAGGVDDHATTDPNPDTHNDFQYHAHTRKLDLTVTRAGQPAPGTSFTLQFEGNQGHDYGDGRQKKMARLHKADEAFDATHPWTETLDVTSDGNGKASVWVLSSDVISQPKLQAMQKSDSGGSPTKIGEIGCDFVAVESKRRFSVDYDEDEDTGWKFGDPSLLLSPNLTSPGDYTSAKVYLKSQIDESIGNVDGNWQVVNSHQLLVQVAEVVLLDGTVVSGSPDAMKPYAIVMDQPDSEQDYPNSDPQNTTTTRTTAVDGSTTPQIYVKSGSDISKVSEVRVEVVDLSQWQS